MDTTRKKIRQVITALAGALTLLAVAVVPASAQVDKAARPDDLPEVGEVFTPDETTIAAKVCNGTTCSSTLRGPATNDAGGYWASSRLWLADAPERLISAMFAPRGEWLYLTDRTGDYHVARADVLVTDTSDRVLDRDTFYADAVDDKFNLGTPDGSGDIAEGHNVWIRVCLSDTQNCAGWVRGVA